MNNRKRIKWILVSVVIFPLVLLGCYMLYCAWFTLYPPPFIPAVQWQVEAGTHTGKTIPAEIYHVKGHGDVLFVHIDSGGDISLLPSYRWFEGKRWFAVDFSDNKKGRFLINPDDGVHVFETFPSTSPYLYHPINGRYGVEILHAKIEELWHLSDMGDTIVFSNEVFFVSMTQANSGRPPVEVHRSTWEKENR